MSNNIASLGIKVDSTDVSKADLALDKLVDSGKRAESAAKSTGDAWTSTGKKVKDASSSLSSAATAAKQGSDALKAQQAELAKLLGKIDPVTAALGRLDDQQQALNKFKAAKVIDLDTFRDYSAIIDAARLKQKGFTDSAAQATGGVASFGTGTKAARENVLQLANALTEGNWRIAVHNAAQLGVSAGATARSLAATLVPIALAGAAIGALGIAYFQAASQASAFNKAVFAGGGAVGLSASGLQAVALQAGNVTHNISDAQEAAIALAASSKVGAKQLLDLTEAASAISQFTGKGAGDVAKSLSDLGDKASDAAAKISSEYGLITLAQYDAIKALEDEGEAEKAKELLSSTLNKNAQERLAQYRASLSDVQRGWENIGTAISNAYAKVKAEVFPDLAKQIEIIERVQKTRAEGGVSGAISRGLGAVSTGFGNLIGAKDEDSDSALEDQKQRFKARLDASNDTAAATSEQGQANQKLIETQRVLDKQLDSLSPLTKRTAAIKLLNEQFRELYEQSAKSGQQDHLLDGVDYDGKNFSGGAYAKLYQKALDDNKDPKAPKAKAYQDDAATKLLLTLKEQQAELESQLNSSEKLSAAAQARIKFEQQIADLKGKTILTADQKSLLANQESIKVQLDKNLAIQKEIDSKKKLADLDQLSINILRLTGQVQAANAAQNDLNYAEKALQYQKDGNTEALERLDTLKKVQAIQDKYKPKEGTVEGVDKAPDAAGLSPTVGGANSEIDRLNDSAKELSKWRERELDKQKDFLDAKGINEETYATRVANINEQAQTKMAKIETAKNTAILSSSQDFFQNMTVLSQSGNSRLAAIGKAAAIANTTIATYESATKAYSALAGIPIVGPVLGAVAAGAAIVAGLANVAAITGVGFESGGYTGNAGTKEVAGVVHGKEYVLNAAATARIGVENLDKMNSGTITAPSPVANYTANAANAASSGSAASGGSGPAPITLTMYNSYPGVTNAKDGKQASALASRQAARAIQSVGRYR